MRRALLRLAPSFGLWLFAIAALYADASLWVVLGSLSIAVLALP